MKDHLFKGFKKIGVRCYDNGGVDKENGSIDRYTVVFTGKYRHETGGEQCYRSMSSRPCHPQGVGLWGSSGREIDRPTYKHLGKKVDFDVLPEEVQRLVMDDALDLAAPAR